MANEEPFLGSPDNPDTAAVVSYITMLGWLIAYFGLYRNKKSQLSAFHIRQTLLLHILSFILDALSLFALWHWIPYSIVIILGIILFALWLKGAMDAINRKTTPLPLIGKWAQELFSNL